MTQVVILTDSTAYLPDSYLAAEKISSVPLNVIWGEEIFEDGLSITPQVFYQKLKTTKKMPTTSQVSVGRMDEKLRELLGQGLDVLAIFISAELSGTVQSALQARQELDEKDQARVAVHDSQNTTMALGFQVLAAARAANRGASLAECVLAAEKARSQSGAYFAVDTLEFLHRGGRIGGAARFFGTALNMKPILYVHNGKIEALERVRTKSKAQDRLVELVLERCAGKGKVHIAAVHANAAQEAQQLLEKICPRLDVAESLIVELSPVIGTHAGPGTICLAFMTES
ncbi:MAG: DegV family protein [Anaerolineales bacterium]|jgi:DegV family protein with EDD domain|nr:DegV family protein [Anaerolineales bacterium]